MMLLENGSAMTTRPVDRVSDGALPTAMRLDRLRASNRHTYVLRADIGRGADYTLPRGQAWLRSSQGTFLTNAMSRF